MTYPKRAGMSTPFRLIGDDDDTWWYLSDLDRIYLESMPKHELESFCQTWLFFGLIHEMLGNSYNLEDYVSVRENGRGPVKALSTSKLNQNIKGWVDSIRDGNTNGFPTHQRVAECLRLARGTLFVINSKIDPEIEVSLVSLAQNLAYAADRAFDYKSQSVRLWPQTSSYWNKRLLAGGWCASQTKLILETYTNIQTLHFLACMSHAESLESHQQCDDQDCKAYQNELGKYETQHVNGDCTCEGLTIDQRTLFEILKGGSLPLLRINQHQSLTLISVDIVPSNEASRYMALFHVWAHGLGNPHSNGLPRCQLSYLWKLVKKLNNVSDPQDARELLLWCDTLSCPLRPKEARELALREMYRTYDNATYVLVLEKSLLGYDLETTHLDELWMRILNSSWRRRLWTLQEGALAATKSRLWFQLRDNAVSLGTLVHQLENKVAEHDIGTSLLTIDIRRSLSWNVDFLRYTSKMQTVKDITISLRFRSVSVLSDEPLLVANLLSLDIARVLDGPDSERYNRLWRQIHAVYGGVPQGLIFRMGPRLTESGLRWAPATLLGHVDQRWLATGVGVIDPGILTANDGLLVKFPGFRLSLPQRPKGLSPNLEPPTKDLDLAFVRDEYGSWYLFKHRSAAEQDFSNGTLWAILHAISQSGSEVWAIHPKTKENVCLIIEVLASTVGESGDKKARSRIHVTIWNKILEELLESFYTLAKQLSDSEASRRIASFDNDGEIDSSLPEYKVSMKAWEAELQQLARSEKAKSTLLAAGHDYPERYIADFIARFFWGQYLIKGEKVPESQRWCID